MGLRPEIEAGKPEIDWGVGIFGNIKVKSGLKFEARLNSITQHVRRKMSITDTGITKFYEEMIKKYERRVRKIEDTPDPTRAKSNKLLYEALAEKWRDELEGMKAGKPVAYGSAGRIGQDILAAMGFCFMDLFSLAEVTGQAAQKYMQIARNLGYSDRSVCDIIQTGIGLALSGDLPRPSMVVGSNIGCDPLNQMVLAIGHHFAHKFNVPMYAVDRYQEGKVDPLEYVTQQIYEMIEVAESKVPGVKFDEGKLLEIQKARSVAQSYLADVYKLAQAMPCPIKGMEAFRIPDLTLALRPKGLDYFRAYRDEVKERVEKGVSAVGEEKMRAMWCVTGPFFTDGFAPLEKRGISVPIVMLDVVDVCFGQREGKIDWTFEGRKISPVEQVAKLDLCARWMGPAEKWIQDVLTHCRLFRVDMVIYFIQTGCPTTLTSAKIVTERVEKELGIPVLSIVGWQLDSEKWDQKEYEERLGEFADMCLSSK